MITIKCYYLRHLARYFSSTYSTYYLILASHQYKVKINVYLTVNSAIKRDIHAEAVCQLNRCSQADMHSIPRVRVQTQVRLAVFPGNLRFSRETISLCLRGTHASQLSSGTLKANQAPSSGKTCSFISLQESHLCTGTCTRTKHNWKEYTVLCL